MRLFISYHSPDRAAAVALDAAIRAALPKVETFLDQSNLRYGHNWQPALYEAIERADAFITIIGNRLGNWQTAEYYAAHDKKINQPQSFTLLPIVIADRSRGPVPNLPGLSQLHWIECSEPTAPDVLPKVLGALSGKPVAEQPKPWLLVNPYRGLMALEEQDSEFFFGRELETAHTIDGIIRHPHKVIALVGNSGVGKSSLVQAGVISGLKRQKLPGGSPWPEKLKDSREWAYLSFRPADEPIKAMVTAFVNLWYPGSTDPLKYKRINEWTDHLAAAGSLAELLDATRQHFAEEGLVPPRKAFVYVDQGEELYNRGSDTVTLRLSRLLAEAAASSDFIVMLSQRSDYYGNFQANRELFDRSVIVDVAPLKADELIRVLREPAARLQVSFYPPELPEQLVEASRGQPGALALLADLMIDVWEKMQRRGKDGVIRALEDAQIIDVEKALATRANRFIEDNPEDRPTIERLFVLRLIKIYEQGNPFRRRVYERDCSKEEWAVLNALSAPQWRLVVTGIEQGEAFAEVAHDILLAKWPALATWIARERQFLLWRTDTEREFNRWVETWCDPALIPKDESARREFNQKVFDQPAIARGDRELLRESRLKAAADNLARRADDIEPHIKRFIARSEEIAKTEAEVQALRLRVFISYSRRDDTTVDVLRQGLESHGIEVLIDRFDIVAGEDWERRLGSLIADAEAFVFVVSPESLGSARCQWELDQATQLGKRIVPFMIAPTKDEDLPDTLKRLNYIKVVEPSDVATFIAAVGQLTQALLLDIDWLREATRLSARASEWNAGGRPSSRLLVGPDIVTALAWSSRRPSGAPAVTEQVLDFIAASAEEASRSGAREAEMSAAVEQTRIEQEEARSYFAEKLQRQRILVWTLAATTASGFAATAALFLMRN